MDPARRIAGRHPVVGPGDGGAAVSGPVDGAPEHVATVAAAWVDGVRARIGAPDLEGLGLGPVSAQVGRGYVTLGLAAPPDLRDLACDVLDAVVDDRADARIAVPTGDLALRAVYAAARARELPVFHDDGEIVVGLGVGAVRIPLDALPAPESAADAIRGARPVPVVRVTGTNGKTTTANLVGAVAAAGGHVPGVASSVRIRVGADDVEHGDWSGPGAARIVARDPRVTFAVLETARGGLLRRGLLVDHADVVVLTNVSDDHLGDGGIDTVDGLARVKLVVADGLRRGGTLVTRGEPGSPARPLGAGLDARVRGWRAERPDVTWLRFGWTPDCDAWCDGSSLRFPGGTVPVAAIPLALGGAARYNVENALAAGLAAIAAGLGVDAVDAGLRALAPDPDDNPGRTNVFEVGGAKVIVDYAHNPDGFGRLRELAVNLAPNRIWMLFGQAGDRPDDLVEELGRAAARIGAHRYVLKPLPGYARGRDPAEVVALLRGALGSAGIGDDRIAVTASELDGVRAVLDGLRPGDLALLLVHEDLDGAVALVRGHPGWAG